ncbi:MAG: sigma-70 family RNA polymerase sigma factor [Myxococcota bacterium]
MPLPDFDPSLVAAATHDSGARDRLLSAWLPVVLGWCTRLAGPDVDAEDLAHDVCLKVIRRLGQLRDPVAFPAWIYRITRDVVRKRRERRARWFDLQWRLPRPGIVPPPDADQALGRVVLRLLQRLPEAQREVVVLCLVEERSREEAAFVLGIPVGTVKSRLRLGTARFRDLAIESGLAAELREAAGWP